MNIKRIGRLIGITLGSICSPSWMLLSWIMRDYFNMGVISQGPQAVIPELLHYQTLVAANPVPIFTQVIPAMIGLLLLSSLYILSCGWLGGKLLLYASSSLRSSSSSSSKPSKVSV